MSDDLQKIRDNIAACHWPDTYYGVVSYLANRIGARRVAEIGVAYGYHANRLLDDLETATYFGVDPYRAGYDAMDAFVQDVARLFGESEPQKAMDRLHAAVLEDLAARGGRANLLRLPSVDGAATFDDGFFDLVFIDGDHTYAGSAADLAAWWPKLRAGGVFCGDDYSWSEVKRAVDEFAAAMGLTLRFIAKQGSAYPLWLIWK